MKLKLAQSADSHPSVISEQEDEINKRRITHSLKQTFGRVLTGRPRYLTPEQIRLIEQATPQERQAYVKRQTKMTLAIFLCLGVIFTWVALQPQKTLPPKPATVVKITDAGSVKEIQLHETSLSTATTVTTTAGVYQVRGGVSGAVGDEAKIEAKEIGTLGVQKSLCIKSSIKTACYPLM